MRILLEEVNRTVPSEVSAFIQFVNRHYASRFPLEPAVLSSSSKYVFFWAVLNGQRVGTTGFIPKTPFLCETVKTVVDPSHRGKGLGAEISSTVEEEIRRRGFKKIMTTILIDNLPMIFLKLKQGYRFEGFHPDHEAPGLAEYSLGKIL
jgi:RimJ/RimL family protein N-acetyltransferase